jgi:hypothetical protein
LICSCQLCCAPASFPSLSPHFVRSTFSPPVETDLSLVRVSCHLSFGLTASVIRSRSCLTWTIWARCGRSSQRRYACVSTPCMRLRLLPSVSTSKLLPLSLGPSNTAGPTVMQSLALKVFLLNVSFKLTKINWFLVFGYFVCIAGCSAC